MEDTAFFVVLCVVSLCAVAFRDYGINLWAPNT